MTINVQTVAASDIPQKATRTRTSKYDPVYSAYRELTPGHAIAIEMSDLPNSEVSFKASVKRKFADASFRKAGETLYVVKPAAPDAEKASEATEDAAQPPNAVETTEDTDKAEKPATTKRKRTTKRTTKKPTA